MVAIVALLLITPAALYAESIPKPSPWLQSWTAINALAREATPEAKAELLRIAADTNAPWLQGRALVALAKSGGPDSREIVQRSASAESPALRAGAYEALGVLGGDESKSLLRTGLQDEDTGARLQAGVALARTAKADAESDLQSLLEQVTTNSAAAQVAMLGYVGTDSAISNLSVILNHKDTVIRGRVIMGAHKVRDPRIVPLLLQNAVSDRHPDHRGLARGVLESHSPEFLAEPLASFFQNGNRAQLPYAIELLFTRPSTVGADALATILRQDHEEHPRALALLAMDTLLAIDPQRYRDVFAGRMDDEDPAVRLRALLALSTGTPEAELYALLKGPLTDENDSVFYRALNLLASQTSKAPEGGLLPYLAPVLAHPNHQRVRRTLGTLKKRLPVDEVPAAVEALHAILGGTNGTLRASASELFTLAVDDEVIRQAGAAQGFLTQWMTIGPFHNNRYNSGFDTVFPPEKGIDFTAVYEGSSRPTEMVDNIPAADISPTTNMAARVKWEPWRVNAMDGSLHLNRAMLGAPEYLTAYSLARIVSPDEQKVRLEIIADDSIKVWVNEKLVASETETPLTRKEAGDREKWRARLRSWRDNRLQTTAEDVTLKQGQNRILAKICNYTDKWYVRVRVIDDRGGRAEFEEIEVVEE